MPSGRKKVHSNPLLDIESIAAMRTFEKVRKEKGWDNRKALLQMINAADLGPILALADNEVKFAEFEIDPAIFSKILTFDLSLNHYHKWALYLWMRECHGKLLREEIAGERFSLRTLYEAARTGSLRRA